MRASTVSFNPDIGWFRAQLSASHLCVFRLSAVGVVMAMVVLYVDDHDRELLR